MRTWLAAAAAAVSIALGLALAACGSSGHLAAGSTGNTPDPSGRSQLEAVVQCLRAHGVPGFPDPVYDPGDGRWHYADYRSAIPQRSQQACQHLDPSAVSPSPPVPQAQFTELVRLAQCIRQHGLPTWPDPNPQGQFRLPPSQLAKSPLSANAVKACQRYIPSGGIDVVDATAP
jgi:hypothetical protein